ncbi:hypothetical protein JXB41_08150 [Candidatus Woesearchaeota archaeon]|nr:hypothetical protein [Candidatus Woesearchaeota archaeon]
MNKQKINKSIVDMEHIFYNYTNMMKWLLNQKFSRKKKMTIFNSITEQHWKMIYSVSEKFPQNTKNPLDTLYDDCEEYML